MSRLKNRWRVWKNRKISHTQKGARIVDDDLKKKGKNRAQKKKENNNSTNNETEESNYMPALPFHQKEIREKLGKQFEHFLEVFKQLHVNISFTEVLYQIPAYTKFMKDIFPKNRKVEEASVVKLTEHCSSINLMPLSIYRKLEGEIGEISSILVFLQLVDQTTIIPKGIVEDVLVWVDKFVFPIDFIVVNMEEKREVPLILGRPFLSTGRAILNI
ncbi:uncharacterized protein LOC107804503 [Nicotiana tabacum]|uniref:Uncharacterized protein LOC107804503 n=1 Tax=Nicotiana tabacum TaxID=4097 RepID=A0A1S4B4W9_TOBAC|nr:PREDICTED: uncharacterized protein LOC107804503 [Nicotiana tabacum]